jgi:hypothetical protein
MNRLRGHERDQVLALAAALIEALMYPLAIVRSAGSRNFIGCAPRAG